MRRLTVLSLALTASAVGLGVSAPNASAVSLVPQVESEINVGLGCIDATRCLTNLTPYSINSIVSLVDSTSGTKSRLFVDDTTTANTYGTAAGPYGMIRFGKQDAGTNSHGFWFRPSEATATGAVGEEKGQLEVGTFTFNFTDTIRQLVVTYFDTEKANRTGVLAINGVAVGTPDYVPGGPDDTTFDQIFSNVSSITLKLGYDYERGSGDGVNFRIVDDSASVPEPGTLSALAAIAVTGGVSLRQRKKANA